MSFATDTLAIVESAISGGLSRNMQAYTIAGRAITSYSLKELWELRDKLRAEVATEERVAAGKSSVRNILVRFDPA